MTQATTYISPRDYKIERSANGSSWTDIGGFVNGISVPAQTRMVGEEYTFDGDTAAIGAGKREPVDITVRYLYSEGASDPFEIWRADFETPTQTYLRWSPKNGQTGEFVFTTPASWINSFGYPGAEAASGNPVTVEMALRVAYITKSAAS